MPADSRHLPENGLPGKQEEDKAVKQMLFLAISLFSVSFLLYYQLCYYNIFSYLCDIIKRHQKLISSIKENKWTSFAK